MSQTFAALRQIGDDTRTKAKLLGWGSYKNDLKLICDLTTVIFCHENESERMRFVGELMSKGRAELGVCVYTIEPELQ